MIIHGINIIFSRFDNIFNTPPQSERAVANVEIGAQKIEPCSREWFGKEIG
jgi:hypothetical protein